MGTLIHNNLTLVIHPRINTGGGRGGGLESLCHVSDFVWTIFPELLTILNQTWYDGVLCPLCYNTPH